ncbi:hypothetical protein ACNOYE_22960 [Nannocystaceae bacterium ST9]
MDELTHEDVQFVKLAGRSPKTINNILATLSTMLECAVEWEEIEELPIQFKRLRVPRKSMDFFDFDEYVSVARGTPTTQTPRCTPTSAVMTSTR